VVSDIGTGIDIRQQGRQVVVDFLNTNVPRNLVRRLDVGDFATPVRYVDTFEQASNARMVVERAARYMGLSLISLTNAIDPELFVMGGGVTRSWSLVAPIMLATLKSSPFIKPARRPRLLRARLGDRAGQVGAVEWARINQ